MPKIVTAEVNEDGSVKIDLKGFENLRKDNMSDTVRFFYLRDENRFPVACVAHELVDGYVRYAVSTHNPLDTYNKTMAKHIATSRLKIGSSYSNAVLDGPDWKLNIMWDILAPIDCDGRRFPQRAMRAAQAWIEQYNIHLAKREQEAELEVGAEGELEG